ncbi:MAG: coenzyme F420-0:L-glutamate ligase [Anaerolineae bacterium]|nr:coenzyme F420-0:L-glutamate ligase [Anaerolineae bacterium]
MSTPQIALYALTGIPEVCPGDDLAHLVLEALQHNNLALENGDVLVVTQKIVSKAEGAAILLDTVQPSPQAQQLALECGKDPCLVEVILQQSRQVVRKRPGTLITETHHGWICANAGVDRSNVPHMADSTVALPLPADPDASAQVLRTQLMEATGADIAVIISDTHGRPWRLGTVNIALGVAGMLPIADLRGQPDREGYPLRVTTVACADELAAAAGMISGQAAEGIPVVLIRGAKYPHGDGRAVDMQRPAEKDMFR